MKKLVRRASAATALALTAMLLAPASPAHALSTICGTDYHQSTDPRAITTDNGTPLGSIWLFVNGPASRWCAVVTKNDQSQAQGIAVTIESRTQRDTDRGAYYHYAGPVYINTELPCVVRGSIAGNYGEHFLNTC